MAAAIESRAAAQLMAPSGTQTSAKGKRPGPLVQRADKLLQRHFEPIRWAIGDLLPEGVCLLVGPPKVGKSWLTLQLAIAIADGLPLWEGRSPEACGDVLVLALEDNDRRMQARISRLLASFAKDRGVAPDVSRLHYSTAWPRMDKGGLSDLDTWLSCNPRTRLVIIDTLARFRPVDTGKSTAYAADYSVGEELKVIAERHRVAILLVHHTRKMVAADVLDTVSGTQALAGSTDALLLLRRERGQMDAALYVTGRDIEFEDDIALRFDSDRCMWSALGPVRVAQRTPEREAILEYLKASGRSTPKDIAAGLGKTGVAVRRLLKKMLADGDIRESDGCYSASLIHPGGNTGNSSNDAQVSFNGNVSIVPTDEPVVTGVTADQATDGFATRSAK